MEARNKESRCFMAFIRSDFFSDALGMCAQMNVILPETMHGDPKYGFDKPVPVLYLLHGMGNDHTAWMRMTSIERYARDYRLAVVMPSTHLGWYTDMYYGYKYFTFISEELPEICNRFFPMLSAKREDTFVAGLSMGGYGALKCAFGKPARYSFAASLSGATDMLLLQKENPDADRDFWESIFGPLEKFEGSDNDVHALASRLAASGGEKPEVYLWCGEQDDLKKCSDSTAAHLRALGFKVDYETGEGTHDWKYWDEQIEKVLARLPLEKIGG